MLRAVLLAAFVAAVAARSLEQERLSLNRDAEFVPQSEIDAVEVPAGETDKPVVNSQGADEGRQFGLPRVSIFKFPQPFFRTSPLFPGFFNSRPAFGGSSSSAADEPDSLFDFSDFLRPAGSSDSGNKRVGDEGEEFIPTVADSEAPEAPEFVSESEAAPRPPQRRPSFFSLSDMFSDFNRRMQSFEDDIANLFKTFSVRVPERAGSEPEASVPSPTTTDVEQEHLPARPGGFGFNLFRPFRHFGTNVFGLRNPSEFPTNYKNSTSKTEIVDGAKVMVNETIVKGGDDGSSHFVHFKVIHMLPHDEEEQASAGEIETPVREVEQKTEQPEEVSTSTSTSTSSSTSTPEASSTVPRVDLSADQQKPEKDGLNPADFGYQVGDNEIAKGDDVEVVNLPSAGSDADLPSGVQDVPAV